ncbi:MAG TPA: SDR family NAD(P)-dependent oxidoreductase, partial [Myxococcota bacterium]|nr:SDR family NAD(P)-dependent oxidoreductase [Myxococcota bacterium]
LSLARDDNFRLSDYRTVRRLGEWLAGQVGAPAGAVATEPAGAPPPAAAKAEPAVVVKVDTLELLQTIIAEKTGYEVAEVDPDYELEADLGIDTVKQAEIFSVVRERLSLARDDNFRLSDYRTVRALAGWLAAQQPAAPAAPVAAVAEPVIHLPVAHEKEAITSMDPPTPAAPPTLVPAAAATEAPTLVPVVKTGAPSAASALDILVAVIAEKTGYDVAEVDPDYELEADLGVDTVKQAEIFSVVRERLALARDDSFRLSDYRTVRMLAAWMENARPAPAGSSTVEEGPRSPDASPTEKAAGSDTSDTSDTSGVTDTSDTSGVADTSDTSAASEVEDVAAPVSPVRGVPPISDDNLDLDLEETTREVSEKEPSVADLPASVPPAELLPETSSDRLPRLTALPSSPVLPPVAIPPVAAGSVLPPVEEPPVWIPSRSPAVAHNTLVPIEGDRTLPESFRLRRMVRMARPLPHRLRPLPPIQVLGDGTLAELLARQIDSFPGGTDLEAPLVVIDTGLPVLECFTTAKLLAHRRPRWICLQVEEESSALGPAREAGARAGLARALGKEWGVESQVIRLDPALSLPEASTRVLMELQLREAPAELWLGPDRREVGVLETVAIPSSTPWRGVPVVLLTGGTRGITAEVAREMARRGPCTLILVGRTAPLDHPLVESIEKQKIKAELSRRVASVTPKMVQDALAPLRSADEVRRTMAELRGLGATVEFRQVDVGAPRSVEGLLRDVLDHYGRLDIVVHGAGLEESRRLEDKSVADFRRVYTAKADGGLALAELLPAGTHFVSMGSVAGFFGNPGQVDYAAANAAMAAVCELRPWSL